MRHTQTPRMFSGISAISKTEKRRAHQEPLISMRAVYRGGAFPTRHHPALLGSLYLSIQKGDEADVEKHPDTAKVSPNRLSACEGKQNLCERDFSKPHGTQTPPKKISRRGTNPQQEGASVNLQGSEAQGYGHGLFKIQFVPPVNIPIQPLKQVLKWAVNSPTDQNGIPLVLTHSHMALSPQTMSLAAPNMNRTKSFQVGGFLRVSLESWGLASWEQISSAISWLDQSIDRLAQVSLALLPFAEVLCNKKSSSDRF